MKDRLKILLFLLFFYFIFIDPSEVSKVVGNLDPTKLTALATLAAVIVALFGEQIRGWLFPSKIEIVGRWQNIQNNQGQTRLLFRNNGSTTAYEVEVYVGNILDSGIPRDGFLPVPLIWTHTSGTETKRNLHPRQYGYYLDICRIDNIDDPSAEPKLPLIYGAQVEKFEAIYNGNTTLQLVISQKSEKLISYDVELEWIRGKDKFVRVVSYIKK